MFCLKLWQKTYFCHDGFPLMAETCQSWTMVQSVVQFVSNSEGLSVSWHQLNRKKTVKLQSWCRQEYLVYDLAALA